ncbi:signal peptidase I [Mariniluteicoccus flavus]
MTAEEPRSALRSTLSFLKEVLIVILGAMVVSALLRAFVFEPFTIPSGSMENTLAVKDKVIAQKVTDFRRGDVIVFKDPGEWVPGQNQQRSGTPAKLLEFVGVLPNSSDDFLTKRVIGMPGDRVSCCDAQGRLMINGQPITEDYLYADANGRVRPSEFPFEVVVPAGRLFVMGDHRNASADSRCHLNDVVGGRTRGDTAFVPIENVVGPVSLIVAPFDRWQQLKTPPVFAGVKNAEGAPAEAKIVTTARC